ncbi:MAG: molybdopterin-dependent oxidoreductase [Verrucomicrobiales bacterium]|nr:molybdopterin-dependent oxidoreductase [Verrucomicrobiales bacterium]
MTKETSRAGRENVLETALVLAPYAHARIESVEVQAALDLDGVHAVLTARDIPGQNSLCIRGEEFPLLAGESVLYHSQPVAAVVAKNEAVAREAAGLVRVEYKPQIPVLGIDEALAVKSFHGEEQVLEKTGGRATRGEELRELTKEFTISGHRDDSAPGSFEALALPGKKGELSITASLDHSGSARSILAGLLGVKKEQITIESSGEETAFPGSSGELVMPAIACLAAIKSGSPVRAALDGKSWFGLRPGQNPVQVRLIASYDSGGRIHRLDGEVFLDGGWENGVAASVLHHILHHLDGAYHFGDMRVRGRVCRTNSLSWSGTVLDGKVIATALVEEVVAGVALELKMKPETVRGKNLYGMEAGRAVTPYGQEVEVSVLADVWEGAKELSSHEERAREIAQWNNNSSDAKRGLSLVPVKIGCGMSLQESRAVEVEVILKADGAARVVLDGMGVGKRLCARVAAVIEEELGISWQSVSVEESDANQTVPPGDGELYREALIDACHRLRDKLRMVAARCLEQSGVEISDMMELNFSGAGICDPENPDSPVPLCEVVGEALKQGVPVSVSARFDPCEPPGQRCFRDFAFGAAVVEALVDGFTGEMRLLRVDIVQEGAGQVKEPLQVLIGSAFMRGTGWLTGKKTRWMPNGEIKADQEACERFHAVDLPLQLHCELLGEGLGGMKNPEESAFCLAICAREAIREAIVAFGGVKPRFSLPHPLSSEAVYFSIEASDR